MNSKTHSSTDAGTITTKILRRTAATVAGLALIIGGFIAATPAHAEGELTVTATSGPGPDISVSGCSANSPSALYRIEDSEGNTVIRDTPVPGWDAESDFIFAVSMKVPGTYTIFVTCLGYSGLADRTGSAEFTATTALDFVLAPSEWKSGDRILLTVKGAIPGELATFGLGDPDGRTLYRWTATVGADGVARLSVVWPGTEPNSTQALTPGPYSAFAVTDSADAPYAVTVQLLANSQWVFGKGPVPGGGEATLPNTGN